MAGPVLHANRAVMATPRVEIYFLPIITPSAERIVELQRYCRTVLHVETAVLPTFRPSLTAWDPAVREWSAEALADQVIEHEETRLRDARVVVIGITADDLRSDREGWVFGWRTIAGVALASYAHLAPDDRSPEDADAILRTRLRRIVTRYIGLLHHNLPTTPDKTSVLSARVDRLDDLDTMRDDLQEAGFLKPRPAAEYRGPVDLATGIYVRRDADLALDDAPRVVFERTYRSNDTTLRWLPFGVGTNHSYGSFLIGDAPTLSYIHLVMPNGSRVNFRRVSPGTGHLGSTFINDDGPSVYLHSRMSWKDGWLLDLPDGSSYRYPACSPKNPKGCTMSGYRDKDGHEIRMSFNAAGDLARIETEHHHTLDFHYDANGRIALAWDDGGKWTTYEYDARGRLTKAVHWTGTIRQYTYDEQNRMIRASDGTATETMAYDAQGRCSRYERSRVVFVARGGRPIERGETFMFDYNASPEADRPHAGR